jgi:hypothetical protein
MFNKPNARETILWDTINGMWIYYTVEQALNAGRITMTVIPIEEPYNHWRGGPDRFKLIVLGKLLLQNPLLGDKRNYS